MKNRNAQTATEFLIITSVVLVIAVLVMTILADTTTNQSTADDLLLLLEYGAKSPLAITQWSAGDSFTTIYLKNTGNSRLQIDKIRIAELNYSLTIPLGVDAEKLVIIPGSYTMTSNGFQITYTDLLTDAQYVLNSEKEINTETVGLLEDLIGYWRFDGNYNDSANDGTSFVASGNATITTTNFLSLDGDEDYVESDGNTNVVFNVSDTFSIFLWMNPSDVDRGILFGNYNGATPALNLEMHDLTFPGSNSFRVYLKASNGNLKEYFLHNDYQLGEWYFLGITYGNDILTVFENGVSVSPTIVNNAAQTGHFDSGADYRIGRDSRGGAGTTSFNGSIDEVMVFNKTLSADEILDLYKTGLAIIS